MKKSILFVDDETNFLWGIKRRLLGVYDDCNISFAQSAKDAISKLEKEDIDVIVADYKMPVMDGLKLLKIVNDKYPKIIRVMLTGVSDKDVFEKSKELGHMYLNKPYDIDELILLVDRALVENKNKKK